MVSSQELSNSPLIDLEFKKQICQDLTYNNETHDYYFGSYSHFYIHEEMLKDKVRTNAYRKAIESNPNDFKDKIVLDIGAGTGILSIFAARAGAKHVYAIENAEIAFFAREIVKKNGLEDKITVIKGKMEEIELPVPKVDIIISEWMGYFLLYESMLDCVLWARDKYLVAGGKMLPDRAQIFVASIEDEQYKYNKLNFWNNVYGADMKCLQNVVMKEPLIDVCDGNMINSSECMILDLDLVNCKKEDVEFTANYELKIFRDDRVHALVSWFDCKFENFENPVTLSTAPYAEYTHWKQVVFYMDQDLVVRKGDVLKGSVACRKSKTNFREIDVKYSYHIDAPQCKRDFIQLYKVR